MTTKPVVLFVDDDDDIREFAVDLLGQQGYVVKEARNGRDGLALVKQHPEIEWLLTDIVMPGEIDGWELAHEAKQLRPQLKVLYMSGFVRTIPFGKHGIGYGPLLSKPWRNQQLLDHLRKIEDGHF
jgi:CheY-like chemotaxis protein